MTRYAPLLTVGAVAVLGGALFFVNSVADPAAQETPAAAAAPAAPTAGVPAPEPTAAVDTAPAVVETLWAGRSSGNEVTVAIAVKDGRAVAYVCDGDQVEAWLEGTLTGDRLALSGADGATLDGTVDETSALGSVAVGGTSWPYAAKAVQAPDGLYDGRANIDGVATRIGWIALDGTVTGGGRADGEIIEAPPFDPTAPGATVLDGVPVTVSAVDGASQGVQR
ncbi:hypothetical protein [Pseudonocardia sp.]|uniref:hypothetical protein n=1 Tax=Pseudonocardia sp. TaxID=60912 RepID=UPI00262340FA|nr:hypothetical protein [Pseudonocardia sp.]